MISVLCVIEITQFRFKFPRAEMRLALQSNLEPLNDTLYVGPVSVFFCRHMSRAKQLQLCHLTVIETDFLYNFLKSICKM